jgi:hypothetical protein
MTATAIACAALAAAGFPLLLWAIGRAVGLCHVPSRGGGSGTG